MRRRSSRRLPSSRSCTRRRTRRSTSSRPSRIRRRRVLLLSDVVATRGCRSLPLGRRAWVRTHLRVSGTTASGAPGRLGTVTYAISDGTDDQGARVEGEATVYLLPPAPELAPIAVDDTVVVRAGRQIDIPVLENDIVSGRRSPDAQSRVDRLVDPRRARVRVRRPAALPRPDEPGEYTIEYSVSTRPVPRRSPTPRRCACRCCPTTRTAPPPPRRSRAAC